MKRTEQRLLVSLDVLLDTRLGALNKMNTKYPELVLAAGWTDREGDFYEKWIPDFDRDKFNTIYWNRGTANDVHTKSIVTGYLARLIADVKILRTASENHPMAGGVVVDINVWPYVFSDNEVATLKGAMAEYIGDGIRIEVTRIDLKGLSPKSIRGRWCSFSIYNFDEWLLMHSDALLKTPIPSVVCIAPRLLKKPLDADVEMDPTLEVSGALVEFLGVEWITPQEVSIAI
jgi:hypothetical protein